MNKVWRSTIVALALLVIILIAAGHPAHAGQGGHDGWGGPEKHRMMEHGDRDEWFLKKMAARLDLSEAQQARIREIHESSRNEMDGIREAMRGNRRSLHALNPEEKDYMREISRLAREQGQLHEQRMILRAKIRQSVHAVLTPEQRQMAETWRQQRLQRCGERAPRADG